jgi:hypothetical protein
VPVVGVVENMKGAPTNYIQAQTEAMDVKFLTEIPFDSTIESAIGNPKKLLATQLGKKVQTIAQTA